MFHKRKILQNFTHQSVFQNYSSHHNLHLQSVVPPPPTQIIHPFVTPSIRFSIIERITSTSDEGKSVWHVISFDWPESIPISHHLTFLLSTNIRSRNILFLSKNLTRTYKHNAYRVPYEFSSPLLLTSEKYRGRIVTEPWKRPRRQRKPGYHSSTYSLRPLFLAPSKLTPTTQPYHLACRVMPVQPLSFCLLHVPIRIIFSQHFTFPSSLSFLYKRNHDHRFPFRPWILPKGSRLKFT